jgi:hypothetical protein
VKNWSKVAIFSPDFLFFEIIPKTFPMNEVSNRRPDSSDFRETTHGAHLNKSAYLIGMQNIVLGSKVLCHPLSFLCFWAVSPHTVSVLTTQTVVGSGVLVRGDLAKVKIGKYCLILENSVIRPSFKVLSGGLSFFPTQIGSYTHIGKNCVIEALKIGSFVRIGDNCIIVGLCVYFMPKPVQLFEIS